MAREVGVGMGALQRWQADAQSEADKSAWCREHGLCPGELDQWRASCTSALAEPEEARATPQATRATSLRIGEFERDLQRWKARCARTLECEMTGDGRPQVGCWGMTCLPASLQGNRTEIGFYTVCN